NSCNLVLVFFPSRLCAHLALHSFPTRRSSDLTPQTGVGTMLDHVGILVADWNKAKAFYDAAFAPLGITLLNQIPEQFTGGVKVGGYGEQTPDFWLTESAETGPGRHFAFRAASHADVDAFHAAAIAAGATDNG